MRWFATVYVGLGRATPRTQVNVSLDTRYNMLIPGNFDTDTYSEIALWQRAYDSSRQAMYVYDIDGRSAMNKLSGRVWNWTNRWWTHMK
jgi:hypothetical protein